MPKSMFAKKIYAGLPFFIAIGSCFGGSQVFGKTCSFQIKEDTAKLTWTGYKFTEKKAVSGSFGKISWSQNKAASSLKGLMESISWEIDTSSVSSGDKARDFSLYTKFFELMKTGKKIAGNVKTFDPINKSAVASIEMNGVTHDVKFKVDSDKSSMTFSGQLKLSEQFQVVASVNSLAAACKELHTGKDGKAVTWDEVGLEVSASITETCI